MEKGPSSRTEAVAVATPPDSAASPVPVDVSPSLIASQAVTAPLESMAKKQELWNTKNLGLRLGVDFMAAAAAGALVAPVITMIDRGIIENASGRQKLGASIKNSLATLLLRPHHFVFSKLFGLIFALYTGTYLTANTLDTTLSTLHRTSASSITSGPTKFVATSTSNLALCLYKDSKFTQYFGALNKATKPVRLPTYALFTVRDCLTIFASFNVPPLLAPHLQRRFGEGLEQHVSSIKVAQFIAPACVQLFSTPLHLLGLDLYNRENVTFGSRVRKVSGEWLKSSVARMGRIIPAFGVGGVVNMSVREKYMKKLQ